MEVTEKRATATSRHSRANVPEAAARLVRTTPATRNGTTSHRSRSPRSPARRPLLVLVALGTVATLLSLPLRPSGPDTTPPGNTALTAHETNGPDGRWSLIFSDEFDGVALDNTKWLPCISHGQLPWPAECTGWKNELQSYRRDNIEVRGGALRLVGRHAPGGYSSGAITTARDVFGYDQPGYSEFTYRYGYTEVRMRTPAGAGLWPAVWSLPYNSDGDEIDHVEIVKGSAFLTLHTGATDGGGQFEHVGTDFTQGWHIIGTEWRPDRITWYVDGAPVYTLTSHIPDRPMFVQANLAIGGDWPGPPDAATPFPASMEIDYIRVFQAAP